MDKLLKMLNGFMMAAQAEVSKYAPPVWYATLRLIQISSAWDLLCRVAWSVVLILIPVCINKFVQPEHEVLKYGFDKKDKQVMLYVVSCFAVVIVILIWATSFSNFLGYYHPRLYLMYQLAQKAHLL
jgi:hypothetical protein